MRYIFLMSVIAMYSPLIAELRQYIFILEYVLSKNFNKKMYWGKSFKET